MFQGAEAVTWRHFAKKKLFLKNFRIQRKTLVPESSFKVAECFKKQTLEQVFICKFHKILRNVLQKLFLEPLQRFTSEIAKFQAASSLFLKESVFFNCISIRNSKTWYFLIHPPLISYKMMLTKHISITTLFQKKKTNKGSCGHGISKGIEKSKQKFQNQLKKKLIF